MRNWVTEFTAIRVEDGEMKTFCGPHVAAPTMYLAQEWCSLNAGHLMVIGELICEIPCEEGTYNPDWPNKIDYDKIENN